MTTIDDAQFVAGVEMDEAEEVLVRFLDECSTEATINEFPRTSCATCNASRSMYCFDCFRLLVPRDRWPEPLLDGSLRLPFDVDIILDDRRSSATGVQLKVIMASIAGDDSEIAGGRCRSSCRLYDIDRGEEVPNFCKAAAEGAFLLFPDNTSKPLSSIVDSSGASRVKRLVILDCKWSKSSIRFHPSIADLPRVHLDRVQKHSFYWRWHNAGEGMLSTVEALYYCAWDVATVCPDFTRDDRAKLVNMLWLFGLQREVIQTRYRDGNIKTFKHKPTAPFLETTKEFNRALRQKQKHEKKTSGPRAR